MRPPSSTRAPRADATAAALAHARAHRARFVEELKAFIRFPSVSAQPARRSDVRRCAAWLAAHLREIGMRTRVEETSGAPLVHAAWRGAPGRPTLLVYGHYDVQPAGPLAAWTSPPFEPVVRGGDLLGRGACDDKGQLWAHVKALEAWLRSAGRLPLNVVCLFEGEEEAGSGGLLRWLRKQGSSLGADAAVISDMAMRGPGRPALTYALRGAVGMEVEARGPARDLHSGLFGGAVANPLEAICRIVAGLRAPDGGIAVAGLYDAVRDASPQERARLRRAGPSDADLLRSAAAEAGPGEAGFTAYERVTLRPSLSVNGVVGGYGGPGAKAVIPSRALAKLSLRIVPDQDPAAVAARLRRRVSRLAPAGVRVRVRTLFGARPAVTEPGHPVMRAAASALREAFGAEPVFLRSGGTIPVVSALRKELGIPVVLMGLALPDDRMHGPNEKFHLPNLYRGIEASVRLMATIGRMQAPMRRTPAGVRPAPSRPTRSSHGGEG